MRAQLGKALEKLRDYPDGYLGIDVKALRAHCAEARQEVAAHPESWVKRVAPLRLAVARDRLRGDEPEHSG